MPHPVIQQAPVVMLYPRVEPPSSSRSGPRLAPGSTFFKDTHVSAQMISSVFLYIIDKPVFLASLALGAIKPISDFYSKHTVTKKGNYEHNEESVGDIMVSDTSDPIYERKIAYAAIMAVPIVLAQKLKEESPILTHVITGVLGLKMGFDLAQRAIQWLIPPPKK